MFHSRYACMWQYSMQTTGALICFIFTFSSVFGNNLELARSKILPFKPGVKSQKQVGNFLLSNKRT